MFRMWSLGCGTGAKFSWGSIYCLFLLLAAPLLTQAQNYCNTVNPAGFVGFTLSKTQACVGEQITVTNGSGLYKNVTFVFNYSGNGFPATTAVSLPDGQLSLPTVFTGPGTYTVLQTGSNVTGFAYCQVIQIVENAPTSFSVSSCGNRTATLTIAPDPATSKYDSFSISWGDGTSDSKTQAEVLAGGIAHTYAGAATSFSVTVQGIYNGGGCPGKATSQPVTITGGSAPNITALTTNSSGSTGTITITYQGGSGPVQLQQKDAGGTYKPTGLTATTGTFTVTTDTQQPQCFNLLPASTCGVATPSTEVCSLVLTVQAQSQQNTLSWKAYAGPTPVFVQYAMSRNGAPLTTLPAKSSISYIDQSNIQCGTQYCYTLSATFQGQAPVPVTITSAPVCATGINPNTPVTGTRPAITALKTNSDGTISINYQSSDPVQLQQKDAGGAYKPVSATITAGFITVATATQTVQCFKVVTSSLCGAAQESEEVCSMVLGATAASQQNNLAWQAYAGSAPMFTRYRIYRNSAPLVPINAKSTITYSDKDNIECGVPYCYYLETTVRGQTETIITSAPVCVTGINTAAPAAIQSLFVTIENGDVRLQGLVPTLSSTTPFTATVSRADGGSSSFQPLGTLQNSLLFIDNTANVNQQSYCYKMSYQLGCGPPASSTLVVCTVWLTSKTPTGIDWSANSPFAPGPVSDYIVETLDPDNNTTTFLDLAGNTHYDPDLSDPNSQRYRYRIVAYDANGTPSYSNYYEFRQDSRLYVPTAFTPNGDRINDTFLVRGVFVDQFSLTVYSRWGDVVFHSTDVNTPWDGTVNGQPALPGEYAYRLDILDLTGKRVVKAGPILLIR